MQYKLLLRKFYILWYIIMNEGRIAAVRAAKGYTILPVKSWMQLEIHEKITDWNNTRTWRFKGLVIKVTKPNHADGTFTVRGKAAGMTIEKIYPLSFPNFEKLVLLDQFKVRRAKLYYIRDKVGKDARMKSLLTNADKWVDLLQLAQEDLDKVIAQFNEDQKQFAWSDASVEETDVEETSSQDETSHTEEVTPADEDVENKAEAQVDVQEDNSQSNDN